MKRYLDFNKFLSQSLTIIVLPPCLLGGRSAGTVFMLIFGKLLFLWWYLYGLESPLRLFGGSVCLNSLRYCPSYLSVNCDTVGKGIRPYHGECL